MGHVTDFSCQIFSRCCNTCADVREAYRNKQWSLPDPEQVEQCKKEHFSENLKSAFTEGCQIYGYLEVNRVIAE